MERKKKSNKGGVYLAVCCCAVIVAMVGYANRLTARDDPKQLPREEIIAEDIGSEEVSHNAIVEDTAETEQTPSAVPEEKTKESPKAEEIKFTGPVSGKVIEEFTGDDLVYNEALKDWRAHSGVDFDAKIGDEVKASAKGTVEDVFDSNMGRCVIIDHNNGFKTMYANLEENTKVKAGDTVASGDVVGYIGATALGDVTDAPHLHFEMTKSGTAVNPCDYLE